VGWVVRAAAGLLPGFGPQVGLLAFSSYYFFCAVSFFSFSVFFKSSYPFQI
jgi:hypothetical protein